MDFNKKKLLEAFEKHYLTTLREYYRRPSFSFISKMIDEIYSDISKIDEIANQYGIEFEEGGKSELIITEALYRSSDNKYHIFLSDKAIENIKNGQDADDLKKEIESFLWHEETHKQQNQEKNSKQPYFSDFDSNNWEEVKRYLSQYVEIDAFARAVAADIWGNGADSKDLAKLEQLPMTQMSKSIVQSYKQINGKVWHKFLTEISNWYNEPHVGGKDEYRLWLKNHEKENEE